MTDPEYEESKLVFESFVDKGDGPEDIEVGGAGEINLLWF